MMAPADWVGLPRKTPGALRGPGLPQRNAAEEKLADPQGGL